MISQYTAHLTPMSELDHPWFKWYTYLLLNLDCALNSDTIEYHYNAIQYNVSYTVLQRLGWYLIRGSTPKRPHELAMGGALCEDLGESTTCKYIALYLTPMNMAA